MRGGSPRNRLSVLLRGDTSDLDVATLQLCMIVDYLPFKLCPGMKGKAVLMWMEAGSTNHHLSREAQRAQIHTEGCGTGEAPRGQGKAPEDHLAVLQFPTG